MAPMAMAMPRQAHDIGVDVRLVLQNQGDQHPEGQADDGHEGTAHVQQKEKQTRATMIISSMMARFQVSMARWMRSERS